MSAAAAFDRVAPRYDEEWTGTPAGRAQRGLVWWHIDRLFRWGDSILDVGCGTGEDAAHFVGRGVRVHATDVSEGMVNLAARRGGFTTAVVAAEEIQGLPASYDGAISNFGALNCVPDLASVSRRLAEVVRPGGRVAVCLIGHFCLWETFYYAARLDLAKALRRVSVSPVRSSLGVPVYYHSVAALRKCFAPEFACERWVGIGLSVPPSYVRLPAGVVRALGVLDTFLAGWPFLRGLADHRLLILVRK